YPRVNIARLNYDGTVDAAFSTGNDLNGPVYAVVTDYGPFTPGGINGPNIEKVLIGGAFTSFGGTRNWFARLADTGLPDFNVQSSFVDGVVKSLRVQADQRILLGGAFTHSQSNIRNGVARLIPNSDLIGVDGDWAQCFPN